MSNSNQNYLYSFNDATFIISNLLEPHVFPVIPGRQEHIKCFLPFGVHFPPFLQGFSLHALSSHLFPRYIAFVRDTSLDSEAWVLFEQVSVAVCIHSNFAVHVLK